MWDSTTYKCYISLYKSNEDERERERKKIENFEEIHSHLNKNLIARKVTNYMYTSNSFYVLANFKRTFSKED